MSRPLTIPPADSDLPAAVRVVVRDWLNSNQVVLLDTDGCVVIDSGYVRDASDTVSMLADMQVLGTRRIDLLVNTHCHSDHMGGNSALRRAHDCRIGIPAGEAPLIRRWDQRELWLAYADQRCDRFDFDQVIEDGQRYRWGGLEWEAIAAPGHDMHALMYHCAEHRLLISGDALWENGFGVLLPGEDRALRIEATRRTLDTISALEPRRVIPGHGRTFGDVPRALERAYARLDALAADELRMARAVLKTMFMFALLDRNGMPAHALPGYLENTGLYAEFNRRYFGWTAQRLAEMLVGELDRAGAVEIAGGTIRPRRA